MLNLFELLAKIKREFSKKELFSILLLTVVFFATRLIYLDRFPIFTDEGIYIHWANLAWHDASWRFVSLTDGRQPLQTWGTIPFLKLFPDNLLLGGRLFGVFSGFFGLIGMYVLTRYLFGKRAASVAGLLFIITPFYLFFDRLAMVDSFALASSIWIFFLSILLVRTLRLDVALIFGLLAGFFLLAKSNTALFFGLALFAPLARFTKNMKKNAVLSINYGVLYIVAGALAFLIYSVQMLSPYLHYVGEKNKTFVLTFSEFLSSPFLVFWHNVVHIPYYVIWNLGIMTFVLGTIGIVVLFKRDKFLSLYFIFWFIIPYGILSFFMRILSSRYVIFLSLLFIPTAAYFIASRFRKKFCMWCMAVLILTYSFTLYFDYTIINDYKKIPFVPVDYGQYIEGWPAGWGAKEIIEYARDKSKEKDVVILAEGDFGMTGDVLTSLLKRSDKITIKAYWPLTEKNINENLKETESKYVYAVFSMRKDKKVDIPSSWPLTLIQAYPHPGGLDALQLYMLKEPAK